MRNAPALLVEAVRAAREAQREWAATPFTERATGTMFFGMVPSFPSRIWVFFGVMLAQVLLVSAQVQTRSGLPVIEAAKFGLTTRVPAFPLVRIIGR